MTPHFKAKSVFYSNKPENNEIKINIKFNDKCYNKLAWIYLGFTLDATPPSIIVIRSVAGFRGLLAH